MFGPSWGPLAALMASSGGPLRSSRRADGLDEEPNEELAVLRGFTCPARGTAGATSRPALASTTDHDTAQHHATYHARTCMAYGA
eukprot:43344-Pyramimonas_sp.AAC.1